jgi:hypothetical protein
LLHCEGVFAGDTLRALMIRQLYLLHVWLKEVGQPVHGVYKFKAVHSFLVPLGAKRSLLLIEIERIAIGFVLVFIGTLHRILKLLFENTIPVLH